MQYVCRVLNDKGSEIWTVAPDTSVYEALEGRRSRDTPVDEQLIGLSAPPCPLFAQV